MNYRTLLVIIVILILLNATTFYFLRGKNQAPQPQLPTFTASDNKSLTLPTEPYQSGIEEVKVLYIFSGKITEVSLLGDNLRTIKLDTAPKDAPEFRTTLRTRVFKTGGEKAAEGKVEDLAIGQTVSLSMTYNIKTQNWELEIINIRQ